MTTAVIDKLRKLKAHAESAEKIGSEAEAQAFAAMFQQLLLKHKLGMSDIEFAEEQKTEKVSKHWIDWEEGGVETRAQRVRWIERLSSIVAKAYFCQIMVQRGSSSILLVGKDSDRQVAEYVLVTLVRTAEQISWREYNNRASKASRNGYKVTKGFRASFLEGFTQRLKERLDEELRAKVDGDSTALVRVNNAVAEVNQYMARHSGGSAPGLSGRRIHNTEGYKRGQDVANGMDINGRAMNKGGFGEKPKLGSGR
jgi:hypothetical protein